MLSHVYATVAHFFVKALRNITKAVHNFFALIDIICKFALYAAFMGLVEKGKRGIFHMKSPVFLFINENFYHFSLPFQNKCLPLQHPKYQSTMKKNFQRDLFCTLRCGKRKRPSAFTLRRRTPTACLFQYPKNQSNYDCKN